MRLRLRLGLRLRLRLGLEFEGLGFGLRLGLSYLVKIHSFTGGWEEKWRLKQTSAKVEAELCNYEKDFKSFSLFLSLSLSVSLSLHNQHLQALFLRVLGFVGVKICYIGFSKDKK